MLGADFSQLVAFNWINYSSVHSIFHQCDPTVLFPNTACLKMGKTHLDLTVVYCQIPKESRLHKGH